MADTIQLVDEMLAGNAVERTRLLTLRELLIAAGVQTWMWPTENEGHDVTQTFGNDPEYYGQFGLPGHEGIDFRTRSAQHPSGTGSDIYAVDGGKIVEVLTNHPAYGVCVRQDVQAVYAGQLRTIRVTYAHGQTGSIRVVKNQVVSRGHVVMLADSTGNVRGAHLHITCSILGYTYIDQNGKTWPFNIIDPTPLFGL